MPWTFWCARKVLPIAAAWFALPGYSFAALPEFDAPNTSLEAKVEDILTCMNYFSESRDAKWAQLEFYELRLSNLLNDEKEDSADIAGGVFSYFATKSQPLSLAQKQQCESDFWNHNE